METLSVPSTRSESEFMSGDSPNYRTKDIFAKSKTENKTKVICTLGPSSWDVDMIVKLIDAGMNVARLNFSHGDHKRHQKTVDNIKEA